MNLSEINTSWQNFAFQSCAIYFPFNKGKENCEFLTDLDWIIK